MNRASLAEKVAHTNLMSQAQADRIIVSVFEEIMQAVADGDTVTIIGFGTFKPCDSAPRKGRNPTTGETVAIPARRRPKFIAGTYFKECVAVTTKKHKKK